MIVLDASALVDALVEAPAGERIEDRMGAGSAHAPAHLDAEAISALSRMTVRAPSPGSAWPPCSLGWSAFPSYDTRSHRS